MHFYSLVNVEFALSFVVFHFEFGLLMRKNVS